MRAPRRAPGAIGAIAQAALLALLAATGLTACTDTSQQERELALGDEDSFGGLVQPYVGLRCGSLDCHGDAGRALRLFAEDGLRLRAELREQPITIEEVRANVVAFAAVSPDTEPAEHLALVKGLAVAAGGFAHVGDDVWPTTDDPGYQCLLSWLEGAAAADAPCIAAFDDVAPQ
jgi:hypothetical protein